MVQRMFIKSMESLTNYRHLRKPTSSLSLTSVVDIETFYGSTIRYTTATRASWSLRHQKNKLLAASTPISLNQEEQP